VADPILRFRGLTYRYPGAAASALAGVDLSVEPGEFVVIAGRSGSGKSTLLRAGCGLVPHFHGGQVEGELEVAGMDVRSHGPAELAEAVGLVAQEPETQVVSTTVRSEIELPLELRGASPEARARAVEEVSLALAIDGLLDRATDTLSGGELQRVALASALATRPRLVLLDEPTSQLDPVAGDELISLLRGGSTRNGQWRSCWGSTAWSAVSPRPIGWSRWTAARSPTTEPRRPSSNGPSSGIRL
jgi:energy-coupling factor transporter ATP-binding protein EcfA2